MKVLCPLLFVPVLVGLTAVPRGIPHAAAAISAKQSCKVVRSHGKKQKVCKPASTYSVQAGKLVAAYFKATTDDARVQALEGMMSALHVTVYGSNGTVVVHGAGTQSDPFMVEVLLQLMAHRTQMGDTSDLTDLAHDLASIGIADTAGKPLTADVLGHGIESGIKAAASAPERSTSLAPLLVRDLGLHDSPAADLATNVPANQVQLDPIQRFLVASDILIPWAAANGPTARAARASTLTWLFGGGAQGPSPVEQAVQAVSAQARSLSLDDVLRFYKAQAIKTYWFDIHKVMDGPILQTHYGPKHDGDGGLGGKWLTFDLHADVPRDSGTFLGGLACDKQMALLGLDSICNMHDLNFMHVDWSNTDSIQPYGTLSFVNRSSDVGNGESMATFYPNTEPVPGLGPEKIAAGVITAKPQLARRLDISDPKLAALVDAQYGPYEFPWKVSYHETPALTFTLPQITVFERPDQSANCRADNPCANSKTYTVQPSTVHLCRLGTRSTYESPESGQIVDYWTGGHTDTIPITNGYFQWRVDPTKLTFDAKSLYSHIYIEGSIKGADPKAYLQISGPPFNTSSSVYDVNPSLVTVPATVDTSC